MPQVPYSVWAVLFTVLITLINVRGIRVTARAGNVMMALMTHLRGSVRAAGGALGCCSITAGPDCFTLRGFYRPGDVRLQPLMLGAAIASLSYIGFDAISTLAEDTIDPERDIVIATVLVCVIQTVFCVVTVYPGGAGVAGFPLVPGFGNRDSGHWPRSRRTVDDGLPDVHSAGGGSGQRTHRPGRRVAAVVSAWAAMASSRAASSRTSTRRYSTPTRSIYVMGAVSLAGSLLLRFQLAVELLNFGAFVGFILVNLSVIRHFYLRLRQRQRLALVTNLIFPAGGRGGVLLRLAESEREGPARGLRLARLGSGLSGRAHARLPRRAQVVEQSVGSECRSAK